MTNAYLKSSLFNSEVTIFFRFQAEESGDLTKVRYNYTLRKVELLFLKINLNANASYKPFSLKKSLSFVIV